MAAILDFVDSGHDLIVAADVNASDLIREIAIESGVDFDEVSLAAYSSEICKKTVMSKLYLFKY